MIKARADNLLVFGISEENVKRLKDDMPIKIDLSEMGMEGLIIIFYKETDQELIDAMQPYLGPDTKLRGFE